MQFARLAAFGRLRIDVIELRKVGRIFHIAEKRQSVSPNLLRRLRRHSRKALRRWCRKWQRERATDEYAASEANGTLPAVLAKAFVLPCADVEKRFQFTSTLAM